MITVHKDTIQLGAPQQRVLDLLNAKSLFGRSGSPRKFPESAPRPAIAVAKYLAGIDGNPNLTKRANLEAFNDLRALGIAKYDRRTGDLVIEVPELFFENGEVNESVLRNLIDEMPGARSAIQMLEELPTTGRDAIGEALAQGYGKTWSEGTRRNAGAYFRAWARYAGIQVIRTKKSRPTAPAERTLFD